MNSLRPLCKRTPSPGRAQSLARQAPQCKSKSDTMLSAKPSAHRAVYPSLPARAILSGLTQKA